MKPSEALQSWTILNAALLDGDEEFAKRVLRAAKRSGASEGVLRRIHSRINRLRAMRERSELAKAKRSTTRRS